MISPRAPANPVGLGAAPAARSWQKIETRLPARKRGREEGNGIAREREIGGENRELFLRAAREREDCTHGDPINIQ